MGAGASAALGPDPLPLTISKSLAQSIAGDDFDAAAFDRAASDGAVPRDVFLTEERASAALMIEVVKALAIARSDPRGLAGKIRARLSMFKGNDFFPPERGGKVALHTKEGKQAVEEALGFLDKQVPLAPIEAAAGLELESLRLACEDHLATAASSASSATPAPTARRQLSVWGDTAS